MLPTRPSLTSASIHTVLKLKLSSHSLTKSKVASFSWPVLAKQTATEAAEKILATKEEMKIIEDIYLFGKEVKIKGDKISEIYIINKLKSTGIPILSEESEFKEIPIMDKSFFTSTTLMLSFPSWSKLTTVSIPS